MQEWVTNDNHIWTADDDYIWIPFEENGYPSFILKDVKYNMTSMNIVYNFRCKNIDYHFDIS